MLRQRAGEHVGGRPAGGAEVADGEATDSLGEAVAGGVADKRRVGKAGRLPADGLVEQQLAGGADEQVSQHGYSAACSRG